jgi:hypothetical protein
MHSTDRALLAEQASLAPPDNQPAAHESNPNNGKAGQNPTDGGDAERKKERFLSQDNDARRIGSTVIAEPCRLVEPIVTPRPLKHPETLLSGLVLLNLRGSLNWNHRKAHKEAGQQLLHND